MPWARGQEDEELPLGEGLPVLLPDARRRATASTRSWSQRRLAHASATRNFGDPYRLDKRAPGRRRAPAPHEPAGGARPRHRTTATTSTSTPTRPTGPTSGAKPDDPLLQGRALHAAREVQPRLPVRHRDDEARAVHRHREDRARRTRRAPTAARCPRTPATRRTSATARSSPSRATGTCRCTRPTRCSTRPRHSMALHLRRRGRQPRRQHRAEGDAGARSPRPRTAASAARALWTPGHHRAARPGNEKRVHESTTCAGDFVIEQEGVDERRCDDPDADGPARARRRRAGPADRRAGPRRRWPATLRRGVRADGLAAAPDPRACSDGPSTRAAHDAYAGARRGARDASRVIGRDVRTRARRWADA